MPNQHYVMTPEQIEELRQLDLPFCPSAFQYYVKGNFGKYKAYMKLAAFRVFGYDGSNDLEESMRDYWKMLGEYNI